MLRPKEEKDNEHGGKIQTDPMNGSPTGMYKSHHGLDAVEMTWTGPEYMYHMLQRNDIVVPNEGLLMLRLASLSNWHTPARGGCAAYTTLESASDVEVKPLVTELDLMLCAVARQHQQQQHTTATELSAADCNALWTSHYADVVAKYNVDGLLAW